MTNHPLPAALTARLAPLLEQVSRKDLATRMDKIGAAYRAGGTSAGIATKADGLAYLVARLPATYAAIRAALGHTLAALPDFAPATLLDVGAGPGTASWAVRDAFPGLAVTLRDPNPVMRALAAALMPDAAVTAGTIVGEVSADLVIAAYVLAELPEAAIADAALSLWRQTGRLLLLVEPGTPAGFARLGAARAALLAAGGHVAAPCTHDRPCPLAGRSVGESQSDQQSVGESQSDQQSVGESQSDQQKDWCHFSQRLARSRDHLAAKHAAVPFEDERYGYLAISRAPVTHQGARILRPPNQTKAGIGFALCDADGLRDGFVARRDKDAFRQARRLDWGDLFRSL